MNVANLQLEGLLMAVASLNQMLVDKGIISKADIDSALQTAESGIADGRLGADDLSPSNRDAVCFPIRLLRLANQTHVADGGRGFHELTKAVGQTKQR